MLANIFLKKLQIPCPMVKLKINGISIDMPYKPYPSQIVTISKLLLSFQTSTSALIESPTGTGKSFSIICSILAYQNSLMRQNDVKLKSKIYICTRTHSQINQLIEQLRKTSYNPRITILGSKAQYCINKTVERSADLNTECVELIKLKKCVYFTGKDKLIKQSGDRIFDIEELRTQGRQCGGCPYFASRAMVENADLVFAPYNYLIDAKIRSSLDIFLENSIIVIDEAHNIEDVCRAAGSLVLSSRVVEIILHELSKVAEDDSFKSNKEKKEQIKKVNDIFVNLSQGAKKTECDKNSYGNTMVKKGKDIIKEFERIGITMTQIKEMGMVLKMEFVKDLLSLNTFRLIEEIVEVFRIIEGGADSYAYCFQKLDNIKKKSEPVSAVQHKLEDSYVYNLWLLDPGLIFKSVMAMARSVCLLSGTLTPFQTFYAELKHEFAHQVCAPHILRNEQIFVASIKRGHLGQELCGTYKVVESSSYLEQITKIIENISGRLNGGGTLVFVPNYSFLDKITAKFKNAFVEPRSGSKKFAEVIKAYQERVKSCKGAIFFCVYRGKAAEGINFQDEYARAVIAIGIPFPSIKDPQIVLKKEYNDINGGSFNGRIWYETQAYRAINQAVGRIVRHSNDWGAVYLLDSRFSVPRNRDLLSSWVSTNLKMYTNFEESLDDFTKFVALNESKKQIC